jgi:hypothetical protein
MFSKPAHSRPSPSSQMGLIFQRQKLKKWKHAKTVDVNKPGWRAIRLDPDVFAAQGYQIWPAPKSPFDGRDTSATAKSRGCCPCQRSDRNG